MTRLKNVPIEFATTSTRFVLKDIKPFYKYVDKKRTDEMLGYAYTVIDRARYDSLKVKVFNKTPMVSVEAITEALDSGNPLIVEFDGATVTPYYSTDTDAVEDSFKAVGVRLVNED